MGFVLLLYLIGAVVTAGYIFIPWLIIRWVNQRKGFWDARRKPRK